MPGYDHQVFVSYRRVGDWSTWVTRLFAPKLRTYLAAHLPGHISVYVDEQIPTGAGWQVALDQAIDGSCVMVPVFMNNYFSSPNCRYELARMLHREENVGFRTPTCNDRLILPVSISKRNYFPDLACTMQDLDLSRFALPHMAEATEVHQQFDEAMNTFCQAIADALDRVPPQDPKWAALNGASYVPRLDAKPFRVAFNPRLAA